MRPGILVKTFASLHWGDALDAVMARGLDCVQFNFACAGLPAMPDKIEPQILDSIARELQRRRICVAAVSGTFNMIDPDVEKRREGLRRLEVIAASCAALGTPMVTLCTGTRDPQDMWRAHPLNDSAEAWQDLAASMKAALKIAERHHVCLGVEPETANVINSAKKARRLLDEMQSPRLKIIMDAANLLHPGDSARMGEILEEAFALLGRDIALAHAKDFVEGEHPVFTAAGQGTLDWPLVLRHLMAAGYDGPLILHGLAQHEVKPCAAFLRRKLQEIEPPAPAAVSGAFAHDGIDFHFQTAGAGVAFFFQHGLGDNLAQAFSLCRPPDGIRLIGMDFRAHGRTRPVGPAEKINLGVFAEDLLALMDHLQIDKAVVGGISMGAAVALNFALRHPDRLRGLVLHRPAWLNGPRQDNMTVFSAIARLIRDHGPAEGLKIFKGTELYQKALAASIATAESLVAQFLDPRAEEAVARLERIPLDAPISDRRQWQTLAVPVLVMGNHHDVVHPFEYGTTLAREIPGAEFQEVTSKKISVELHQEQTRRCLENFLRRQF